MSETTVFQAPRVRATVGYKRNMGTGTYETLNLEYSVEDNCRINKDSGEYEKVSEAFTRVADYVEAQLIARLKDIEEEAATATKATPKASKGK